MDKLHALYWPGDIESFYPGHQFSEIFKERIYAPYLEHKKDAVVIDLGANLGIFSLYAAKYSKQVYAIEPDPELFECIVETLKTNNLNNVKAIRSAVFIDNATYDFWRNSNRTMGSLHQAVRDPKFPPIKVPAVTLDKLFEDENIDHVDLLKIDIEGSEVEVISSAGFAKVADKIDVVIGETHDWSGRHPNQIVDAFKQNGFIVESIPADAHIFVAKKPQGVGVKV